MQPMAQTSTAAESEVKERDREDVTAPPDHDRLALAGKLLAGRFPPDKGHLTAGGRTRPASPSRLQGSEFGLTALND
jgi:hypothetical protein